jgi:hypothetical protein
MDFPPIRSRTWSGPGHGNWGLYVVSLFFAYTPLISGDIAQVLQIGFFSLFGIYATYAIIQWYAEGLIGWLTLPLFIAGGIWAYWPLAWVPNIIGALAITTAIVL